MPRPLRYAPAVAFALLALAFVGLWVRSYYRDEFIQGPVGDSLYTGVRSCIGVVVGEFTRVEHRPDEWNKWRLVSEQLGPKGVAPEINPTQNSSCRFGFLLRIKPHSGLVVVLPYWFLALSSLALAALLTFKPFTRFTVRGLLITTTLLAAVLGLAVYAI